MKFNFIQKKGVVVALAAALAVGSFGVTALASGAANTSAVVAQSAQSPGTGGNDTPSCRVEILHCRKES